jgi:hypothetical protein
MIIEDLKQTEKEYKIKFYMGSFTIILLLVICLYSFITNTEFNIIMLLPLGYISMSTFFIYKDWKMTSDVIKWYKDDIK